MTGEHTPRLIMSHGSEQWEEVKQSTDQLCVLQTIARDSSFNNDLLMYSDFYGNLKHLDHSQQSK